MPFIAASLYVLKGLLYLYGFSAAGPVAGVLSAVKLHKEFELISSVLPPSMGCAPQGRGPQPPRPLGTHPSLPAASLHLFKASQWLREADRACKKAMFVDPDNQKLTLLPSHSQHHLKRLGQMHSHRGCPED